MEFKISTREDSELIHNLCQMLLTDEIRTALQKYLIVSLKPLTQAPPELLAQYVIAMINNDKSNEELKLKCEGSLKTFLHESTKPFVKSLFDLLENVDSPDFVDELYRLSGADREENDEIEEEVESIRPDEDEEERRALTLEDNQRAEIVAKKLKTDEDSKPVPLLRLDDIDNRSRDNRRDQKLDARNVTEKFPDRYSEKKPSQDDHRFPPLDSRDVRSRGAGRENTGRFPASYSENPRVNFYNRGFCEKGPTCPYFHGEPVEMNASNLEQLKRRENVIAISNAYSIPLQPPPLTIPANQSFVKEKHSPYPSSVSHSAPRNKPHTENNFAPPDNINEYKPLTKHNPNEYGPSKRPGRLDTSESTLLCVLNIPRELNTIGKIDEHFSKFGPIVNIEILQNEKKARVKFSSHRDAVSAMKSPEAVLGNRFIKVLWNELVEKNAVNPPVPNNTNDSHTNNTNSNNKPVVNTNISAIPTNHHHHHSNPKFVKPVEPAPDNALEPAETPDGETAIANADDSKAPLSLPVEKKPAVPVQDPMALKVVVIKKKTDIIKSKKKLLDQMIETLKKPDTPLETSQKLLKEVATLKESIKDDLAKLTELQNSFKNKK